MKSHADFLLGEGVLAETIAHFHMEAVKAGTPEAWQAAYDKTEGVDFLWIVYTGRMRNAGDKTTGLFESIALNNQLGKLMKGCDSFESQFTPGAAAKHRAECKALWAEVVREARAAA